MDGFAAVTVIFATLLEVDLSGAIMPGRLRLCRAIIHWIGDNRGCQTIWRLEEGPPGRAEALPVWVAPPSNQRIAATQSQTILPHLSAHHGIPFGVSRRPASLAIP